MGIRADSESAARTALAQLRAERVKHIVAPVRVALASASRRLALTTDAAFSSWAVDVTCEDGTTITRSGRRAQGAIALPPLPQGYHRVRVAATGGDGRERIGEQRLIVVPPRCPTPRERLQQARVFGVLANLYSVRSARNWGFGDLSDLRRLVEWSASIGAAFVGINPLHALDNRGEQISPYSPLSRLFRNVLYLDVTAAPEWGTLPARVRAQFEDSALLERLRGAERIDYDAARALKWPAFVALHREFAARHRGQRTPRSNAYARYLREQGDALDRFAKFNALHEHFEGAGLADWRHWPAAYRDPDSAAVGEFRVAEREAVDLHCYLQFELDRQLGGVAAVARQRGAQLGVYQDLALGSSRQGSDPWMFPSLFLDKINIGAPPDNYSPTGQDWQLPAIDPRALTASGYDYWVRLLRGALRHAGALRIDHVLGLVRQYWIPSGASGAEGAYVRFPTEDLLGILALESQRAGALVIGEDLGTVPRDLPRLMQQWSLLSTRVLYFEQSKGGRFRAARRYPRRALVGANTHDLPPLSGFWSGHDLGLRRKAGVLADDAALNKAKAQRARERRALLALLRREGGLTSAAEAAGGAALTAAAHDFLDRTPSVLASLSLDDLTGEESPVNLPGVTLARYASWSRRMSMPLERLANDPMVAQALNNLPNSSRRTRRRS